jgi:hypothetical protein
LYFGFCFHAAKIVNFSLPNPSEGGGFRGEEADHIMKNKKEKSFDAVKMMREAREKISAETQNMTFEELKKYIDSRIKTSGLKQVGK